MLVLVLVLVELAVWLLVWAICPFDGLADDVFCPFAVIWPLLPLLLILLERPLRCDLLPKLPFDDGGDVDGRLGLDRATDVDTTDDAVDAVGGVGCGLGEVVGAVFETGEVSLPIGVHLLFGLVSIDTFLVRDPVDVPLMGQYRR